MHMRRWTFSMFALKYHPFPIWIELEHLRVILNKTCPGTNLLSSAKIQSSINRLCKWDRRQKSLFRLVELKLLAGMTEILSHLERCYTYYFLAVYAVIIYTMNKLLHAFPLVRSVIVFSIFLSEKCITSNPWGKRNTKMLQNTYLMTQFSLSCKDNSVHLRHSYSKHKENVNNQAFFLTMTIFTFQLHISYLMLLPKT